MYPKIDLHTHIVPETDDGARSLDEALKMLRLSVKQGVTDVFCTSHNGYSTEDIEKYISNFNSLKSAVETEKINIRLHKGCEILCADEYMDDILYGLEIGVFLTLGESDYVLIELYPDARPSEALFIIDKLKQNGYKPIIAHMERNYNITGIMVNMIIQGGALIQVNAESFTNTKDNETQLRAKELLKNKYVHFIGSDAHHIDYRSTDMSSGTSYILDNADTEYAEKILCGKFAQFIF